MQNSIEIKKIIVAPLNWGLGHATRCIPIILSSIENGYTPVIASDGDALQLLQKEFPDLEFIELPSYNIKYKKRLKIGLLLQFLKLRKAVKKEQELIADYVRENDVFGIVSDNRFGVRNGEIPCVYITHQIRVLSGITTIFTSKIHQRIIRKFDECWIPDVQEGLRLSGKLSEIKNLGINVKYLGILSRLKQEKRTFENSILILLSGPEPQRSMLEERLLVEFEKYQGKIVLVRGRIETSQVKSQKENLLVYNYVLGDELQELIIRSELVLCRSGYSSILDLAKLGKKAFFIPTPNQTEQEYLAIYLESQRIVPYSKQGDFKLELLEKVKNYSGFQNVNNSEISSNLFNLFERKRKG